MDYYLSLNPFSFGYYRDLIKLLVSSIYSGVFSRLTCKALDFFIITILNGIKNITTILPTNTDEPEMLKSNNLISIFWFCLLTVNLDCN